MCGPIRSGVKSALKSSFFLERKYLIAYYILAHQDGIAASGSDWYTVVDTSLYCAWLVPLAHAILQFSADSKIETKNPKFNIADTKAYKEPYLLNSYIQRSKFFYTEP